MSLEMPLNSGNGGLCAVPELGDRDALCPSVPITPSLELTKRRLIHTENCVGIPSRSPLYSHVHRRT